MTTIATLSVFILIGFLIFYPLASLIEKKKVHGYARDDYYHAQTVLDDFKERGAYVCTLFEGEYVYGKKDILEIMKDGATNKEFYIIEIHNVLVSFDLGFENYGGEVWANVRFPFDLMNMTAKNILANYKVLRVDSKFGNNLVEFRIVEKNETEK